MGGDVRKAGFWLEAETTRSGNDNWTDGFFFETFLPGDPFKDEGEAMSEDSQAG